MKTTSLHHSSKLSSSVAFIPQEDGRRTKLTYIVLSSWLVLPARTVVFQRPKSSWPMLPPFHGFVSRCRGAFASEGGRRSELQP
jgi:hypothetical protein